MNVPPAEATVMDLAPFGNSDTVPLPAFTVPPKETSLAVMETAEFVVAIEPLVCVKLPVPSVVIVTPLVPVNVPPV